MLLNTKYFGEIEINEEQIITFEEGIPSFENMHRYSIISTPEPDSPFCWLQCIEQPELAFALANPFLIKKDYDFELTQENLDKLDIKSEAEIAVYAIVVIPEDVTKASMNLRAPVIVNSRTMKAAQIIIDISKYDIKNYIFEELKKQ